MRPIIRTLASPKSRSTALPSARRGGIALFRHYAQFPQKRFEDGEKAGASVYYGLYVAG